MLKPDGRPVSEYEMVPVGESVAWRKRDTQVPARLVWSPGLSSVTTELTAQPNVWVAVAVPSVADTVTLYGLSVSALLPIVPLTRPVDELMLRPVGRPSAL